MTDASELSLADKKEILNIITTLRTYQLLGILEARNWIGKLFPEFEEVRDTESDDMFRELAQLTHSDNGYNNQGE